MILALEPGSWKLSGDNLTQGLKGSSSWTASRRERGNTQLLRFWTLVTFWDWEGHVSGKYKVNPLRK